MTNIIIKTLWRAYHLDSARMSQNYHSNGQDYNSDNRRDSFPSRGGPYRGRGSYYGGDRDRDHSRGGQTHPSSRSSYSSHSSAYHPYRISSKDETTPYEESRNNTNTSQNSDNSEPAQRSSSIAHTPVRSDIGHESFDRRESAEPHQNGRYSNDHRNSYDSRSRGGSYRGSYRGGYRGRGGSFSSPYSRDSSGPAFQSSGSRAGSFNDSRGSNSPYSQSRGQDTGPYSPYPARTEQEPVKKYSSPWIKLLSLDNIKTSDKKFEPEYIKLRDEKEELYKKSLKNQEKLKEMKLKNLKLDFEIDTLKTYVARDQVNVDLTQEKLDAISLL